MRQMVLADPRGKGFSSIYAGGGLLISDLGGRSGVGGRGVRPPPPPSRAAPHHRRRTREYDCHQGKMRELSDASVPMVVKLPALLLFAYAALGLVYLGVWLSTNIPSTRGF